MFSGVIVDSLTGKPVADVSVSFIASGADPIGVATTGSNGQFQFNYGTASGEVLFTKIGYFPGKVLAGDLLVQPQPVIQLEPGSAETLAEVVVTPGLKWMLGAAAIGFIGYKLLK